MDENKIDIINPFKDTNEERRSISFNATIDDKSFDVFI